MAVAGERGRGTTALLSHIIDGAGAGPPSVSNEGYYLES